MKRILGLLFLVIIGVSFTLGNWYGIAGVEPVIAHQGQIQVVELPPEIITIPPEIKYVDRISVRYNTFSDWESEEELVSFLELDQTNAAAFIDMPGQRIIGAGVSYALMLRANAAAIGKWLPTEKATPAECQALTGLVWVGRSIDSHLMNHAIVKDTITGKRRWYYVEPQTDRIWPSTWLD